MTLTPRPDAASLQEGLLRPSQHARAARSARHVTAGAGLPLAASPGSLSCSRRGGGDPARGHVIGANRRSAPSAHSHWSFVRFYTEMGASFFSLHGCSSGCPLVTCSLGSAPLLRGGGVNAAT